MALSLIVTGRRHSNRWWLSIRFSAADFANCGSLIDVRIGQDALGAESGLWTYVSGAMRSTVDLASCCRPSWRESHGDQWLFLAECPYAQQVILDQGPGRLSMPTGARRLASNAKNFPGPIAIDADGFMGGRMSLLSSDLLVPN